MSARPNEHFAVPPYTAEKISETWWAVMNANGVNCLTFEEKPGAKFTDEKTAKELAEAWSKA